MQIAAARAAIPHTRAFALLGNVDYAVKGGRVPKFARTIANLLRLSLTLATQPDGHVTLGGALWGRHNLTERFARFVLKRIPSNQYRHRIMIGHGDAPEAARALAAHLEARRAARLLAITPLTDMGTALGVHGGPGTLIVGVQRA